MSNSYFQFKKFTIHQENSGMKVSTDACIQAAWTCSKMDNLPLNILDIGAGTGILGLMLKQQFTESKLVSIEPDSQSFIDLTKNVSSCNWNNISIFNTQIQDYHNTNKFDLIICNPPYFNNQLKAKDDQRNNARHDHLLSKNDLAKTAHSLLNKQGIFSVMYPTSEWEEWLKIAQQHALFPIKTLSIQSTLKKAPYLNIGIFSKYNFDNQDSTLLIHENGDYSVSFKSLLKDYYLAF